MQRLLISSVLASLVIFSGPAVAFTTTTSGPRPALASVPGDATLPAGASAEWWRAVQPEILQSPVPDWTAEGDQASAYFGISVGTAGDVNGDGYADVIVGAWGYENGQTDEGRAFVYHGSDSGLSTIPDWTAESDQVGAGFGHSVGTAGDVNGDGYADVIVGAFSYDNGQTDEGAAFVYHGSAMGLSTIPAWTAEGDQANGYFGYFVARAGDVNDDGYADVIIGAPLYDNGQMDEGRALLYHGSASGLSLTPNWAAESDQVHPNFAFSVGTAGDVNGDGYADVIVGALGYDNGQTDEGRAFVYHGSASGLSTTANWTAEGDQANAYFGYSVGTAGDVNGDGYADVIVGARDYASGQTDEGKAFVYHGSAAGLSTMADWTAESDQFAADFGVSVGTAGDVNGDGYDDAIVGATLYTNGQPEEGRALLYHGSASGLSTTAGWTAESDQAYTYFGLPVSTAGDVNDDGYADVMVGAPLYDNGQIDEGQGFAYHGPHLGVITTMDDTAYSIIYGSWVGAEDPQASGGGYRYSSKLNQRITYRTEQPARAITLISYRGPDQGKAKITIDGVNKGTLDLYGPIPEYQYLRVYGGLPRTLHTFVITVLDQKNPASSGTEVRVDGFQVRGATIEDNSPDVQYQVWTGGVNADAYGGSYRSTAIANASVSFDITGPQFTWIAARGPAFGLADVIVDEVVVATVDLYSPTFEWQYPYAVSGLGVGLHTVQIKVLGMHSGGSTGDIILFDGYSVP